MTSARFYHRDPDAPTPNVPDRIAVVAFVEWGETVLMEHRADSDRWCLLGGHMESDQSAEMALRQEVREESGLEVASFSLFGVFSDPSIIARYDNGLESVIVRVVHLAFRVQVADVDSLQVSPESTELRFFTREELRGLNIVETVRPIVDRYLEDRTALVVE
jgi:8-oxo-dGTP pyrophosphatase MutT (NUDIX family)